jgi:hypothetical protein
MATTIKSSMSTLCLVLFLLLCPTTRGGDEVFIGTIADSQCALNVHSLSQSHKEMLESKSVGTTDADCVWYCITERGGHFVLQNKSKVYKLDKQDFSRQFAASKVKITGTLDPQTNTIHVHNVELLTPSSQSSAAPK